MTFLDSLHLPKYWTIFKISFEQEFVYRINFIMWRIRSVIQIIITFFFWSTIFNNPNLTFFGYDRARILTYVFTLILVRAIVLSARGMDVSTDIANGNLSNYLIKPISYFKYWFSRDMSTKILNLIFATVEFVVLFGVLKPHLFYQTNATVLLAFLITICVAIFIYFCILFIVSSIPFWAPELAWASQFLIIIVIIEFLSGALFPIDILPTALQKLIMATPFPYMIFFPVGVYMGKITGSAFINGFLISVVWAVSLWFLMKHVWRKGLKEYQAFGR